MSDDQEFIKTTLNNWKLAKWYDRFIEEDIDKEAFLNISETEISRIITTIGGIRCFLKKRKLLIDSIKLENLQEISSGEENSQLEHLQYQQLSKCTVTKTKSFYHKEKELNVEQKKNLSNKSCSKIQPSTSYVEKSASKIVDTFSTNNSSDSSSEEEEDNINSTQGGCLHKEEFLTQRGSKKNDENNELNKISYTSSHSVSVENTDLEKLLQSFIDGQIIIKFYEKHDRLDKSKRRKLTELLVTQFMFKKSIDGAEIVRLLNADFDILSQKVSKLFPNECQEFYYVPPKFEGPSQKISKGKFPDFYRNKLNECRQIGLIERKQKRSVEDIDDSDIESNNDSKAKRVCKTHLQWLRYNTTPWSSVIKHWDGSRKLRQSFIKQYTGNVYDIFNEYPVLKKEFGYMLLDIDYNILIDEKFNIFNEWPELSKKLEILLENQVMKDTTFVKQLEEIQLYEKRDKHRDAALLSLIPILCPFNMQLRISGGKIWRPATIAESMDSFICHIKVPEELKRVKRRKQERAVKLKETLQPYIIAIGPQLTAIEAFYIIIDDVMYKMENVLKAVDILYKIFQVLNVKYPSACEQVWLFIQKYIYKRITKWDKYNKSVMNLIDNLNRI